MSLGTTTLPTAGEASTENVAEVDLAHDDLEDENDDDDQAEDGEGKHVEVEANDVEFNKAVRLRRLIEEIQAVVNGPPHDDVDEGAECGHHSLPSLGCNSPTHQSVFYASQDQNALDVEEDEGEQELEEEDESFEFNPYIVIVLHIVDEVPQVEGEADSLQDEIFLYPCFGPLSQSRVHPFI